MILPPKEMVKEILRLQEREEKLILLVKLLDIDSLAYKEFCTIEELKKELGI
jgi:hypothetical protein